MMKNLNNCGRRFTMRVTLTGMVIAILVCFPPISMAQDLRFYTEIPEDSLNHSSTYEPFKKLYFSDHEPAKNRDWKTWIADKFLHENFLKLKQENYQLTLDPIFENLVGKDMPSGKNLVTNTRGFRVQGAMEWGGTRRDTLHVSGPANHRLLFSTTYYESQSRFPSYLDSIIQEHRVTPGQVDFRGVGQYMDHSYATAWLRYSPNQTFSFEGGQGKNFFGNGYRSMLLSDANIAYPYFRIDTRFWRIHYVNLWAEFQDKNGWPGYGHAYQKKYGAFHYLSIAVTKNLEISFFEVINWQGRDSTHFRNFELTYLNPIIFLRPAEWSVGSPDNALIGLNLSYRFMPQSYLYGQLLVDEFNSSKLRDFKTGYASNKFAGQLGIKSLFNQKIFVQSEFNFARPYTYSHISSKSNYGHMNFSLAHPLGANFMEWVNFVRLDWGRWTFEGRYSWALFGAESDSSNFGHDIFLPYDYETEPTGVFIGYGNQNTLTYAGFTTAYLLNPYSNFNLFVSILNRNQKNDLETRNDFIFRVGLRSSLRNLYYDF